MRHYLACLFVVLIFHISYPQAESSFRAGEWLKFKLSYSGWFKAGYSTLEVKNSTYKNNPVYHVIGKGWTTGAIKFFFKVNDRYESYFDKQSLKPYKFIRKIYEGGHIKNRIIHFDYEKNLAHVDDLKTGVKKSSSIQSDVQDMLSSYYYLRNNYDTNNIEVGSSIELKMFFDYEIYNFKLKFLGHDKIKTKFGYIKCLKFRPYVVADRVFKEEESLTLWISADRNKVPLKIKADLRVGSLIADLDSYRGLRHQLETQ